uniref:Thioredoxin n=1 Tax=Bostrychia tenella TaxID=324755 RepID=A0A1Z1M5M7_9FLOR|nr:thioredoxin [Bostrychia tenella]ARW61220.1 thioredoxin [Bostrychia tenella]
MSVLQVVDSSFEEEVIDSSYPVLVDFWAPWCGPCRLIAPVIDEIASEYHNVLKVVKVNTDLNPTIATEYGIRSIPTIMLFKGGAKVDTVIGAVPKSTLINKLVKHVYKHV